ncbi:MFS transporter [Paraburkholderia phenoliruptrix]|uniref:Major facilitator family transporter n=2 Tax=Paraburkholderia phenoliruptrix TaxID=252970 RepID=K0DMB7_9BURK|nr:MFS transporter [Paraburkholderia phenoliruptrix]AFT86045.1 major facilitator family transporter [Paraburkholderia phenoliruptrix BR3459a]CAB4048580.1 Sialic acid transporter NanT [Paraburkholderia phenoliruptrix]
MSLNHSTADLAVAESEPSGHVATSPRAKLYRVVLAGSLGTCFEAYDLFLVGTLAAVIGRQFFSGVSPTAALIFTLLGFAAGYLVRPVGAVFFGLIGDRLGRKRVFLVTVALMGLATFAIGLLPTYAQVGFLAPAAFVALRLVQGFALGGEAGGAMIYVAEHVPESRRAFYTSWVQIAPVTGLLLSQLIVQATRSAFGQAVFLDWAWRIPFLLSLVLLALSLWVRTRMGESPEFERLRNEEEISRAPLKEALTGRRNIAAMVCSMFALGPGAAVAFYCAFFYTPFFLTEVLRLDQDTTSLLTIGALVVSMPIFIVFGALSDRFDRKSVICAGFILVVVGYPAIYKGLTHFANPALEQASRSSPVVVIADPEECSTQFNMLGTSKFHTSCDIAKSALVRAGVSYTNEPGRLGAPAIVRVGEHVIASYDAGAPDASAKGKTFTASLTTALDAAGYPRKADPAQVNATMVFVLLVALGALAGMTYGPLAAAMTDLFHARVRFTALSLSYHIGFGWTGGFLPAAAFAIVAANGDMYAGLAYPRAAALIGAIFVVAFMLATRTGRLNHDT